MFGKCLETQAQPPLSYSADEMKVLILARRSFWALSSGECRVHDIDRESRRCWQRRGIWVKGWWGF